MTNKLMTDNYGRAIHSPIEYTGVAVDAIDTPVLAQVPLHLIYPAVYKPQIR